MSGRVRPQCPGCGYDLAGVVRDRTSEITCSECGRAMKGVEAIAAGLGHARPRRVPGWLGVTVFVLLAMGTVVLLAWVSRYF
ncbi:MAG: hypothetical protein ACF8LL_07405 [Phycisphaerales bacterium]